MLVYWKVRNGGNGDDVAAVAVVGVAVAVVVLLLHDNYHNRECEIEGRDCCFEDVTRQRAGRIQEIQGKKQIAREDRETEREIKTREESAQTDLYNISCTRLNAMLKFPRKILLWRS